LKRRRRQTHHKQAYSWSTTGHTGGEAFLLMRPFLGVRRRETGDAILSEATEILDRVRAPIECIGCGKSFVRRDHGQSRTFCTKACHARWKWSQPGERAKAREREHRYQIRLRQRSIHENQLPLR
jgi:hypothetical protein